MLLRPFLNDAGSCASYLFPLADGATVELGNKIVTPSHYDGSVCGRGLSGNPFSSIGFERRHNQLRIVTANRTGTSAVPA